MHSGKKCQLSFLEELSETLEIYNSYHSDPTLEINERSLAYGSVIERNTGLWKEPLNKRLFSTTATPAESLQSKTSMIYITEVKGDSYTFFVYYYIT